MQSLSFRCGSFNTLTRCGRKSLSLTCMVLVFSILKAEYYSHPVPYYLGKQTHDRQLINCKEILRLKPIRGVQQQTD
ncbi:hypothetical protein OXYTRIMIC_126 [Oxytricha trifallax]|uniref:Uncharacterized protein n=1 Tax=Oxytricha trifallax TaxID=1172189 RepID=A0A073IB65_9SPIT|nr:hypothetical protein OXYTRIMIC_126 [Oxytricha trifallax]